MKKTYKTYHSAFELYADCAEHMLIFNNLDFILRSHGAIDYYYIWHDKDKITQEDIDNDIEANRVHRVKGMPKKKHLHVMVTWKCQRPPKAVSLDIFGHKDEHIELINSRNEYLRYMTHSRQKDIDSDKYQYDLDLLQRTNDKVVEIAYNFAESSKETRQEIALCDFFNYIEHSANKITYSQLVRYSLQVGLGEYLRRNYPIIKDIIYEHNLKCEQSYSYREIRQEEKYDI